MGQPAEAFRLEQEAVHELSVVGQLGPQRLDGDLPSDHGIARGINLPDATFAEQPFQFVGAHTARVQPVLPRNRWPAVSCAAPDRPTQNTLSPSTGARGGALKRLALSQ